MNHPFDEFLRNGFVLSLGGDEFCVGWGSPSRSSQASCEAFSVYAPDFFLKDPQPWWLFPSGRRVTRVEWIKGLSQWISQEDGKPIEGCGGPSWDFEEHLGSEAFFHQTFLDLKQRFTQGHLRKAVPVVFEPIRPEVTPRFRAQALLNLLEQTESFPLFVYGVWNESEGVLGATPEVFLQQTPEGVIHTAAVAGTRLKSTPWVSSLLQDPKELEEHHIVIEGICQSFRKGEDEGLGTVKVGQTGEREYPTLFHLVTEIAFHPSEEALFQGRLTGAHPGQFFERRVQELHPTPALGAYPKEPGRLWLEQFEAQTRERGCRDGRMRFGAPFGVLLKSGEIRSVVAIRNLQWKNGKGMLGAGCGVVAASEVHREWREIQGKMKSVKKLLGLQTGY